MLLDLVKFCLHYAQNNFKVYSEIPFNKNLYYTETSQLVV